MPAVDLYTVKIHDGKVWLMGFGKVGVPGRHNVGIKPVIAAPHHLAVELRVSSAGMKGRAWDWGWVKKWLPVVPDMVWSKGRGVFDMGAWELKEIRTENNKLIIEVN